MAPTLAATLSAQQAAQQSSAGTAKGASRQLGGAGGATGERRTITANELEGIGLGPSAEKIDSVRVEGMVLMKIIKHAQESHLHSPPPLPSSSAQQNQNPPISFTPVCGQLMGLDQKGVLDVSNCFSLPNGTLGNPTATGEENENKTAKSAARYTASLLPRLADLNSDASLVGFYVSTSHGATVSIPGLLDALLSAHLGFAIGQRLGLVQATGGPGRGGKIGGAGGMPMGKTGGAVALIYDVSSSAQGHVNLKAYRLSQAFLDTHKSGKYDGDSLMERGLTPSTILEEVPLVIQSNPLLSAFLSTLPAPDRSTTTPSPLPAVSNIPSYSPLSLPTSPAPGATPPSLSNSIQVLLNAIEAHGSSVSTLNFHSRQLAREKTRLETAIPAARRAEIEDRRRQGLPPLPPTSPEEQAFLSLAEPSRLDVLSALSGLQGAAAGLGEAARAGGVREYGVVAGN